MEILTTIESVRERCQELRRQGKTIALVPTMGYLHDGHISLIHIAKKEADFVIVSRFVNPTQFAPNEDLDAYPNDPDHDHKVTAQAGTDLLFEPLASSMYGENYAIYVDAPSLAKGLCGITRPTHFRGVCTVLTKLFNIFQPDVAVFGEKDWQQITIVRRLVEDLNMQVRIVGGPIVREADGLAMSSRNAYLTKEERAKAPEIRKAMLKIQALVQNGERNPEAVTNAFRQHIAENMPLAKVDYASVVNPKTLVELEEIKDKALIAVAVYVGKARLLDNIMLIDN